MFCRDQEMPGGTCVSPPHLASHRGSGFRQNMQEEIIPHQSDCPLWLGVGADASLVLLCWAEDRRWVQWQEMNEEV